MSERFFEERVERILVERAVHDAPMVARLRAAFPAAVVSEFADGDRAAAVARCESAPKRTLVLSHHRGRFIKPFPRHPWYHYGHMYNLLLGFNCYAACHYCFIHTYFDDAYPTMFANEDDMYAELRAFLEEQPAAWISTGEFIDSLQLDDATRHTEQLMACMQAYPRATLELRTKHHRVDHLPDCLYDGTLVSLSINPDIVADRVEAGAASLGLRLQAARDLVGKGYRVAFRIDPIVATRSYATTYADFAARVEAVIPWRQVSRVFLGSLRFDDDLMRHLAGGAASRRLLDAEYVKSPDGKYRLYRGARRTIYRDIVGAIRGFDANANIELVMEPEEMAGVTGTSETTPAASRAAPR